MTIFTPARVAVFAFGLSLFGGQAFADTSRATSEPATVKVPARAEFYKAQGLPAGYRGKTNPYQATVPVVLKGADRYNALCSSCHGLMGFGNGQASGALHPKPADLAWSLSDPKIKDDYLFWTIAEGGAQFSTKMPAFKKPMLTDEQIWQIITYMRAAFEGREARATPPRPTRQAMRDVAQKTD